MKLSVDAEQIIMQCCYPDSEDMAKRFIAQLEEENATLKGKLLAIECAGCGLTMLECECDD